MTMHPIQQKTHLSTDSISSSRRQRYYLRLVFFVFVLICAVTAVPITAQTQDKQKRISARGFVDFGFLRFTAEKSFETILEKSIGIASKLKENGSEEGKNAKFSACGELGSKKEF